MKREKRLEESLLSLAEILVTEAHSLREESDRRLEMSRQILDVIKSNAVIHANYKWDIANRGTP